MSATFPRADTRPPRLGRRACAHLLLLALLGLVGCNASRETAQTAPHGAQRVVSLSPGLTESIIALGASARLVGVSDYCTLPESLHMPRVGSALTPNYEAIARLRPDLILATQVAGSQLDPLARLAPTRSLPWLTLSEVQSSLAELGQLLDRAPAGSALARRFESTLSTAPPSSAPRVLWVLDFGADAGATTWFIRDDSLHGAVLRASGAKNAVTERVVGQPTLTAEQLLRVDPDVILLVLSTPHLDSAQVAQAQTRLRQHFARFTPLRAVAEHRLLVVHHPGAMNLGPHVLDLVPALGRALSGVSSHTTQPTATSSLPPP